MKPLPHRYSARIAGRPRRLRHRVEWRRPRSADRGSLDFDGPGDAWSPEQLLLAAVEACFLLTFRAVAQASRLEFVSSPSTRRASSIASTASRASRKSCCAPA